MATLFAVQWVLPLSLILWLALAAPRSVCGFSAQIAAAAACVWAMALLGIWLMPPWWVPHGFGLGLGLAAWAALRQRLPFESRWPVTRGAWVVAALFTALGAVSAYGITIALRSRVMPPVPAVNLAWPLGPGNYLIVNGGSDVSTNAHLLTLDTSVPRFRVWRGQSYGVDMVQLGAFGLRVGVSEGAQPADPRAYRIHGARVLAPCTGQVVMAVDGLPDMQVPQVDRDHLAGNHVLLRCVASHADGTQATGSAVAADVLLGHLQPGTVRVQAGANVVVGDWLGSVGNSGNTGEPHLHVHAQSPGPASAPLGGDPLPILFHGHYPVRGDRIHAP
jgi:hypothetical protein